MILGLLNSGKSVGFICGNQTWSQASVIDLGQGRTTSLELRVINHEGIMEIVIESV